MEVNEQKKYFTTIGRGHGAPCFPASREDWERLRKEPWLKEMCERIEKGEEELKHKLPVWTPSCAEFKDNHRAIADALKPLPRLMMDFDEKGHTDEIVKSLIIDHSPLTVDHSPLTVDHSPLTVLLIEESVRRGTHVLVELPEGMAADEAQRLMAEATGYEPDKAVKDVARCIYMVPEDHTKYISDRLWITPLQLPRGGEIEASHLSSSLYIYLETPFKKPPLGEVWRGWVRVFYSSAVSLILLSFASSGTGLAVNLRRVNET